MSAYFIYFIIYSFLGFLIETFFCLLLNFRLESRKCFLFSLLCPVYGLGAISIISFTSPFKESKLATFFIGMAAATLIEYVTDIFYREVLSSPFWDYSDRPYNLNGRVCLLYSIFWGILSMALVYWVHPYVQQNIKIIPKPITALVLALFIADAVLSAFVLQKFKTKNAVNLKWIYGALTS